MRTVRAFFFLFTLFISVSHVTAGVPKMTASRAGIKFTENKNQWEKNILYRAQLDGGFLFLESNCFTYNFYDKESLREMHAGGGKGRTSTTSFIRSHAFRVSFNNSSKSVSVSSKSPTSDFCNFFLGNDKSKWVGNAKNYKEIYYSNLYSGIDLQVLGYENNMKYNFIVSPSANPNEIALVYEGLDGLTLKNGSLVMKTSINEMVEEKPYAYQVINGEKVEVPCKFVLEGATVKFKFPKAYKKEYELIIDPVLVFACSSGSIADNFGMTATYDAEGNLFSGGTAFGIGYPTTLGAFDTSWNGSATYIGGRTDVVITKYDSSGTFLRYSTYLGGFTGSEIVTSLVVNAQNELMLYGATGSSDFPVTSTAYDQTFNGGTLLHFICNGTFFDNGTDIYVAKFNALGTALLASTYIGGTMNDGVNTNNDSVITTACGPASYEFPLDSLQYNYGDQYRGEINVDPLGNAVIASSTRSGNFPIVNGFDNTFGGKQDAILFKLNPDFSQLMWSTYLGGTDNDAGYALSLDDSSNVYITGGTRSTDFPTTAGALQPTYNGGKADGYIAKVKSDGTGILFATYWGTTGYDQTYFVQLDKDDDVYVVGQTDGAMPVTSGVYNNPNSGQFITKINDSLNTIIFSTVFGNGNGVPNISPAAFLVDYCENIYVSGWGGNIITGPGTSGMPITPGAFQPSSGDGFNFYLFVVSTNASALLYATYFGGSSSHEHVDGGTSRFDKKGIIYQSVCAGCGGNDDFPVTPGSWPGTPGNPNHNTQNFNCNNGVFKFDFQIPLAQASFTVDYISGCAPLTVQFQNQSTTGGSYLWDFGGGDTTSSILNPIRTFPAAGLYPVQLVVYNPASCNVWDTTMQYVTVYPAITADFNYSSPVCSNTVNFTDSSQVNPVSWLWTFEHSDTSSLQNPSYTYDSAGTYNVLLVTESVNGCKDTTILDVSFPGIPTVNISSSDTVCLGSGMQLNASGGISYSWSPASTLSNPFIANPIATTDTTTTYTVTIQTVNSANDTCQQTLSTTVYIKEDLSVFTADTSAGCAPITVSFSNLSSPTSVYLWDFGNGSTSSTSFNPIQTYSLAGIYNVQLFSKDTASCSIWDTASLTLTINPGITSNFDFTSVPCTNQFNFYDSSAVAPVSWSWNFDDGGISGLQNPTHIFPAEGTYDVQLVSANTYGCKDTAEVSLNYNVVATGISANDTICTGEDIQLHATGGFAYSWSPTSSLSSSSIANPVAHPSVTTTYTVNISTVNSLGDTCLQTLSTTITVIDPSIYSLSASADVDSIPEGTSTIIHAITDTNFTVHWFPIEGLSDPMSFNPTAHPTETTTYTVSILDSTGCVKKASVTIFVESMQCKPENVFVPNTFTPNNDGVNDVLFVRSNDIEQLYFAVYNRWGQMVFETTDIKKGWDGIYNGMLADPAVFAWYLRAKCYNGNELTKKGNTTLIR